MLEEENFQKKCVLRLIEGNWGENDQISQYVCMNLSKIKKIRKIDHGQKSNKMTHHYCASKEESNLEML